MPGGLDNKHSSGGYLDMVSTGVLWSARDKEARYPSIKGSCHTDLEGKFRALTQRSQAVGDRLTVHTTHTEFSLPS